MHNKVHGILSNRTRHYTCAIRYNVHPPSSSHPPHSLGVLDLPLIPIPKFITELLLFLLPPAFPPVTYPTEL